MLEKTLVIRAMFNDRKGDPRHLGDDSGQSLALAVRIQRHRT